MDSWLGNCWKVSYAAVPSANGLDCKLVITATRPSSDRAISVPSGPPYACIFSHTAWSISSMEQTLADCPSF